MHVAFLVHCLCCSSGILRLKEMPTKRRRDKAHLALLRPCPSLTSDVQVIPNMWIYLLGVVGFVPSKFKPVVICSCRHYVGETCSPSWQALVEGESILRVFGIKGTAVAPAHGFYQKLPSREQRWSWLMDSVKPLPFRALQYCICSCYGPTGSPAHTYCSGLTFFVIAILGTLPIQ